MSNRHTVPTGFRFTIRAKLLLLSIAILAVPYIGYEYMRELERHLRGNLEYSLINAARAIAGPMHESYRLFPYNYSEADKTLFIHTLVSPIQTDGYTDDWANYLNWSDTYYSGMEDENGEDLLSFKLLLGQHEQYLYVLLQVRDREIIYYQPTSEQTINSDFIELVLGDEYQVKERYYFSPSAPGRFNPFQIELIPDEWDEPQEYIRYATNIAAEWQPVAGGYNLEIALPLIMIKDRMGFVVGNAESNDGETIFRKLGTAGPNTANRPGRLLRPSPQIEQIIRRLDNTDGRRIWVLDSQGQVLATVGNLRRDFSRHPLNIFYKVLLPSVSERFTDDLAGASMLQGDEIMAALQGNTESRWRSTSDQKAVIVSAATPVWISGNIGGVVVVEETTNNIQMLQRDALVSLVNKTLFVFLAITLLLLAFATRLSFRLRRLSHEAAQAIDEHGRVTGTMSVSRSTDEIGDLSRNYSAMLERLRQYNNYLESLAGKLSHELRTPMAVVQSSLDNLQSGIEGKDKVYLERAQEGIQRLNMLVTRLSEAAKLEQALQSAELETVDLNKMLEQTVEGYRLAYKQKAFELSLPPAPAIKKLSPDLFLQMLDKIVSNAVDFSREGEPVKVELAVENNNITLNVINYGSILPKEMEDQLFNSMVSVRQKKENNTPHLGLGLYIARMIAEFHGGHIKAANLEDGQGVCFSMVFPV
jgi:dedicated sortase system histidine kinase